MGLSLHVLRFSAGMGENDNIVRAGVVAGLEGLGIKMDAKKNETRSGDERTISADDSRVAILVIPTNEELQIALTSQEVLNASKK